MSTNDESDDNLRFASAAAREAHMCKKPVEASVGTMLCLRMRGHDGECKPAMMMRVR